MKFLVDETPNFYDECPFSKEVWTDERRRGFCTLVNERCNLHEDGYSHECYGLKELLSDTARVAGGKEVSR